ncbi:MAG: TlpA family protein disulfide reductase [Acidobacteriota bacterium]|nr:MAG: TlpA family protein disulfide reductase [Acidobacteriota bacterium]
MTTLTSAVLAALAWLSVGAIPAAPQAAPVVPLVTTEGKKISLADGAKLTELVFVAHWCRPCETELTAARRRLGALRREGYRLVLIGVSQRQTLEQFREWVAEYRFDHDLVYDAQGNLKRAFGAALLPWHVVIDAKGQILVQGDTPPADDKLRTWLSP